MESAQALDAQAGRSPIDRNMEYKDYYQILGIPRDADDATIKRAFRRLAREHHPDVSADKAAATERFKEINEAYTVLSDGEKRRRYDSFDASWSQFRSGGASSGPQRTQGQAWPPPGYGQRRAEGSRRSGTRTIDPEDIERIFQAFGWAYSQRRAAGREGTSRTSDFSDFFENLFGGSGQSAAWPRGRDVSVTAQITLEEAYRGTTRVLEYGGGPRIEVTIPRGVQNGTQLRLQGLGQRPLFGTAGDLFVEIELLPHARLRRAGDNLHVEVPVEEQVASQSGRVKVPTIDRSVWLSIPTGTRDGQIFRLRGLGMPARANPAQHGDLFATVRITKHSRPRGRVLDFLRRLLERPILKSVAGLALVGVGLLAFMGQLLSGGSVGWLLVLATSLLLFVWALPSRSQAGILLALTFLAGSALLAASAKLPPAQLFSQGWPLLPMAGGYLLLRDGSQA